MIHHGGQLKLGVSTGARMTAVLAAVLLAGLAARSLVTLFPPLVVGDDGAYYLVQVRAIVRDGALAMPDFPLLFYVQAAVARLLAILMEPRAAVIAAVRITDTLLPLALAVPVFLFARAFVRPGDSPAGGTIAVALIGCIAVASGSSLLMAGGMIKNSTALPCSFLFAFTAFQWLREGRPATMAWAAFWFVLSSLTHMSGIILSAIFGAALLAAGLAAPTLRRRVLLPALVLVAALAGCLSIVHALDPARATRLIHVVLAPGWLFAGSPGLLWLSGESDEPLRALFTSAELWVGNTLGVIGVVTLWRHRAGMDAATRALLVASTLVTFAFSSPLLRPDVLERLALVAYVPGMIPVVYLICREAGAGVVLAPLALAAMLHGFLAVKTLRLTALVPAAHEELARFKSALPPGRVIVITRSSLRWWVSWTMEARFSTRVEPALSARNGYDAVLVLDEIRSGAFGVAYSPASIGMLGAGVRDALLLRSMVARTVAQGEYFRLSVVATGARPRSIEGVRGNTHVARQSWRIRNGEHAIDRPDANRQFVWGGALGALQWPVVRSARVPPTRFLLANTPLTTRTLITKAPR